MGEKRGSQVEEQEDRGAFVKMYPDCRLWSRYGLKMQADSVHVNMLPYKIGTTK